MYSVPQFHLKNEGLKMFVKQASTSTDGTAGNWENELSK
jgi:hypothetical protein